MYFFINMCRLMNKLEFDLEAVGNRVSEVLRAAKSSKALKGASLQLHGYALNSFNSMMT